MPKRIVASEQSDPNMSNTDDSAQKFVMQAKIYSEVHVLVVKWEQSGFLDEMDLDERLNLIDNVCYEYRWQPKRYLIQEHSTSGCANSLYQEVMRWSGDSSHLLIIAYSGHGHLDHNGNLLLSGNGHATINWNLVQGAVQKDSKADVLFFLDTCYAAAALRQYRDTRPLTNQEPQGRQELIAACGREGQAPQQGPGVLSTIWFSLLRNSIHNTIPETTDSLHTKANKLKDVEQSFFRANLSMYTPAIPLQPCYKSLYKWAEDIQDDHPWIRQPGMFRIIVVFFNFEIGPPPLPKDTLPSPLPKDTFQRWYDGSRQVGTVKADFAADFADKHGAFIKALCLRVGPVVPEDARTLFEIKRSIPGYYTHRDAQLIVFEASISLTKRGRGGAWKV